MCHIACPEDVRVRRVLPRPADPGRRALARLTAVAGPDYPVAALTPEPYAAVMERWTSAAAATWNRHLSALVSFTT
ncbi:hypothetical protein [Nonomuraea sp. NPDC049480]|uniref:hypothetical protein n=1 Tax=Nonomuraea sp. NPDC049480 TaxID=3364353 RepID=UPI00378D996B